MNKITGIITDINSDNGLSLINLKCGDQMMKSIVINHQDGSSGFKLNDSVTIMFKETEVFIGKGWDQEISLRNQFRGMIKSVKQGNILAEVVIECEVGEVRSVITVDATSELSLSKGDKVTAMIKTNEVLLSH
ncbi:MAG: TOBE domain-containing protein [Saprospiraceae bacterium]|nr:TOBE domain-containing protein [Saprospiraceae bacterium]